VFSNIYVDNNTSTNQKFKRIASARFDAKLRREFSYRNKDN